MPLIRRSALSPIAVACLASFELCSAPLVIESPRDYQVFQRAHRDSGPVRISGVAPEIGADPAVVQFRIPSLRQFASWKTAATVAEQSDRFEIVVRVPAGGWYGLEVRLVRGTNVLAESGRTQVGVGEVFVVAGQSNSANYGDERQQPKSGLVSTFDGPGWRLADDPQPGATGSGGSFLPPFGDAVAERLGVPVGIVSCGVGATSVREWLPPGSRFPNPPTLTGHVVELPGGEWESKGTLFEAFVRRMAPFGKAGFRAVLWHQGESDANQQDPRRTLPGPLYREYLEKLIRDSSRAIGWVPPWFVALVSYHTPDDPGSASIRDAQRSLWTTGLALEGPDSDALTGDLRDGNGRGVHFSGKGLREHAARWADKVVPWMERLERSGPADDKQGFVQDRLAIGMWVPPRSSDNLRDRYREIAEANFNLVIGTAGTSAAEQLRLCEEFGLKAIVDATPAPADLADSPACWGYLLVDEPNASAFPELSRRATAVRAARPGRLPYVNLFPNYASIAQLGTASYEEHVERFVREFRPEVLSMDHYPAMRPDRDTRDAYCENLATFRRHALGAGIPFWNYFYSMPFGDRTDPSEAQIRWQVFTSLAYGAKGVLYFCYWTPGKGNAGTGEFPKGGALLTAEGRKTRHYEEARRINGELRKLGPVLMKLSSTSVRRVNTGRNPAETLGRGPLLDLARVGGDPHSEFVIGTFRHQDGRRAVLLVNHDYAHTAWPTVRFDANPSEIVEASKLDGREGVVVDDSPELPGLQLSFGPGDGRLFLIP